MKVNKFVQSVYVRSYRYLFGGLWLCLALCFSHSLQAKDIAIGIIEATGNGQCNDGYRNKQKCQAARRNSFGVATGNLFDIINKQNSDYASLYLFGATANYFSFTEKNYRKLKDQLKTLLKECKRNVNPNFTFVPLLPGDRREYDELIDSRAKSAGFINTKSSVGETRFALHRLQRELVLPALINCMTAKENWEQIDNIYLYTLTDKLQNSAERKSDSFTLDYALKGAPQLAFKHISTTDKIQCESSRIECAVINKWHFYRAFTFEGDEWQVTPQEKRITGKLHQNLQGEHPKISLELTKNGDEVASCETENGGRISCLVLQKYLNHNAQYQVTVKYNNKAIEQRSLTVMGINQVAVTNQADGNILSLPPYLKQPASKKLWLCQQENKQGVCNLNATKPLTCTIPWGQLVPFYQADKLDADLSLKADGCDAKPIVKVKLAFKSPKLKVMGAGELADKWFSTPIARTVGEFYLCDKPIRQLYCQLQNGRCIPQFGEKPYPENGLYQLGSKQCETVELASLNIDISWGHRPEDIRLIGMGFAFFVIGLIFLFGVYFMFSSIAYKRKIDTHYVTVKLDSDAV